LMIHDLENKSTKSKGQMIFSFLRSNMIA